MASHGSRITATGEVIRFTQRHSPWSKFISIALVGSEAEVVCDNLMRNTQLRDNLKFATLHFSSLGHPGGIRPPGGYGHDMTCPYGEWGEQLAKLKTHRPGWAMCL